MSQLFSPLNRVVADPPAPGHQITFHGSGGHESLALGELYERAGWLAVQLRERGVVRGDRIGIVAANSLEWVLLDLAALRLGAVTAGFEPGKFTPGRELAARYGLRLLFTDEDCADGSALPMDEAQRLAELPAEGPLDPIRYSPDDPIALKFTSGSTGQPKGLAATAGSVDSSLRAVQEMFVHGTDDDLFVFLPLSLLQQRYWVYSALCYGHDVTVSTYESAFATLRQVRPTVVMGVPAFYELAKRHIEARTARVGAAEREAAVRAAARRLFGPRIRYLWTGSAPASITTLRFFTVCGLPIYEGYGMNETCIVTKNHPGANRIGSVGKVVTGKEVVLDPNGRISVRSAFPVNRRYAYAEPGTSERVFDPDGTVRTGDIGYLDEDGFLFVLGRADDVIALGSGRKIHARPIEERMTAGPAIEECVLFSQDGSTLVAVVSPADEAPDEAAIAAQLRQANEQGVRHERIARVIVAPERFTIANGLLSAQYKPLRPRIRAAFRAQLEDHQAGILA